VPEDQLLLLYNTGMANGSTSKARNYSTAIIEKWSARFSNRVDTDTMKKL
jgi:hypothetical protein